MVKNYKRNWVRSFVGLVSVFLLLTSFVQAQVLCEVDFDSMSPAAVTAPTLDSNTTGGSWTLNSVSYATHSIEDDAGGSDKAYLSTAVSAGQWGARLTMSSPVDIDTQIGGSKLEIRFKTGTYNSTGFSRDAFWRLYDDGTQLVEIKMDDGAVFLAGSGIGNLTGGADGNRVKPWNSTSDQVFTVNITIDAAGNLDLIMSRPSGEVVAGSTTIDSTADFDRIETRWNNAGGPMGVYLNDIVIEIADRIEWGTGTESNITENSAIAYAQLDVLHTNITTANSVMFYWEQTASDPGETHSGWDGENDLADESEGLISSTISSGLIADKPYYYRFYATNSTMGKAGWGIGRFVTKGPVQTVTLTADKNLDDGAVITTLDEVSDPHNYDDTDNSNPYEYNIDNYWAWKEQDNLWNLNMAGYDITVDNDDDIIINAASISYTEGGGNFVFTRDTGPDLTLNCEDSVDIGSVDTGGSNPGKLTITAGKTITFASLDADELGDISLDAGGDITIKGALQNWTVDNTNGIVKAGFTNLSGNIYYDDAIMANVTNGFSGPYDILYENDSNSDYELRPISKGMMLILL